MECEVCGRQLNGRAQKVIIEGAKLLVCGECAHLSSLRWKHTVEPSKTSIKKSQSTIRPIRVRQSRQTLPSEDSVVVENYGKAIRKGREKLRLTHEQLSRKIGEKISLLQKLETEKMIPDLALARKLENTLKIKLLVPLSEIQFTEEISADKSTELTLGDVVIVQERKRVDAEE